MSVVSVWRIWENIRTACPIALGCGCLIAAFATPAQTQPDLSVAGKVARSSITSEAVGLFIGIGKYDYQAGLKPLAYAPDDAVALAHLFVVERGWIRPQDAQLALSGEPKSTNNQRRLGELKQRGVRNVSPTRSGLERALTHLLKVKSRPLMLTFSGHGNLLNGTAYFLPADSDWSSIRSTSLSSQTILSKLQVHGAPKLWLMDSCTTKLEVPPLERTAGQRSFQSPLKKLPNLTVLASCQPGEKSYQSDTLEHGVHTYFLSEAIRACAPTNTPFAALDWLKISEMATKSTRQWLASQTHFDQQPWYFSTVLPARQSPAQ